MGNNIASSIDLHSCSYLDKNWYFFRASKLFKSFVLMLLSVFIFYLVFWFCKPVIMGELEGGGSVAVAVGVSDNWQVTGHTQHVTHDIWHKTCYMWHMTWHDMTWHELHHKTTLNYLFKFCVMPGHSIIVLKITLLPCLASVQTKKIDKLKFQM